MSLSIISLVLAILSNCLYHLFQKVLPKGINPFVALAVTYATALVTTLIILLITTDKQTIYQSLKAVNFIPIGLGIAIVGLELGFLLAYRTGWNMSLAVLYVNVLVTLLLIPIGVLIFKEPFSLKNILGVLISILGISLIVTK